ncbi:MAG TPA: signal peptide peptidase SppA [Cyanobacteria bacterium UBA9971]|nr:signal peptide peptidase SppA [Cyanobacteria bacterium UBA9971]
MKTKIISISIITLCFLSIIVGIINTSVKTIEAKKKSDQSASSFFKSFSSEGDKIALISMQGTISSDMSSSLIGEPDSAEGALKALERAVEDNSVKGVIFRINSPGGTVAMSQEIYGTIMRLREIKPVVVSMADVAASGGYYVASAADRIYADPGTLTGSIGVIMGTLNVQELMTQKLGVKSVVIKSGKFKDTGSMYRPMTTEEHTLLQNLVNSAYQQFLTAIIDGRIKRNDKYKIEKITLTEQILKKYADGRILTGEQAKTLGFVDKLGGLYEAKKDIRVMAKVSETFPVTPYNKPTGFTEMLFSTTESLIPHKNIESYMPLSLSYPRQPLFMWE